MSANDWEAIIDDGNTDIFGSGYHIGVDYWFRLKNVRVEFFPELNFAQFSADSDINSTRANENFKNQLLGFNFNTNFYILNFKGDCDCPTFSKQDPITNKGLFVQLSPGLAYTINEYTYTDPLADVAFESNKSFAFNIGLGLGLDIGISDLITLTPIVKMQYYFPLEWEGLYTTTNENPVIFNDRDNKSSQLHFLGGIHVGIRINE